MKDLILIWHGGTLNSTTRSLLSFYTKKTLNYRYKDGKKKGRKKQWKGKPSAAAFLHPPGRSVRFTDNKNGKEEKRKKKEAKMAKCLVETWRIRYISHTHNYVVSCQHGYFVYFKEFEHLWLNLINNCSFTMNCSMNRSNWRRHNPRWRNLQIIEGEQYNLRKGT